MQWQWRRETLTFWGTAISLTLANNSYWSASVRVLSVCLFALLDMAFYRTLPTACPHHNRGQATPCLLHGAQPRTLNLIALSNAPLIIRLSVSSIPLHDHLGSRWLLSQTSRLHFFYKLRYTIPSWLSHRPQFFCILSPWPPIFSATNVINVLSNLFSWNCDYAQGTWKLGEYELCMWSEL